MAQASDSIIALTTPTAQVMLLVSVTCALGLLLGKWKIKDIGLGVAGCLFTGLFFGHFIHLPHHEILDFIREFGLMLFVYGIGVEIGPSFVSALKSQGLKLNLLAASTVGLGAIVVLVICKVMGWSPAVAAGLFAGATTNTPALGAGQSVLAEIPGFDPEIISHASLSYAVTYPFGILGIIITLLLIRFLFRIDPNDEAKKFAEGFNPHHEALDSMNIVITNNNLEGLQIRDIPGISALQVIITRVKKSAEVEIGTGNTVLNTGDIVHAVGFKQSLHNLAIILGAADQLDVRTIDSPFRTEQILVSRTIMTGKPLLDLPAIRTGKAICSRVNRSGIEFIPTAQFHFQYGDKLTFVSTDSTLQELEKELGNSKKELRIPQMIPIFVGLAAGVIVGSFSFHIPGLPLPLRLGLAGGPLLMGILFSYLRNIGPLVWYLPTSSNLALREMGIAFFLSAVGIKSGESFLQILLEGPGFQWMLAGVLVTLIPLLIVGFVANRLLKINFLSMSGLLAGACTDPPALAFANSQSFSNAAAISYATVYPVAMILRILLAQGIVVLLTL